MSVPPAGNAASGNRRRRSAWRRPVPLWTVVVLVLLAGAIGAVTYSAETVSVPALFGEVQDLDATLTATSQGIGLVSTALVAAGDTQGSAVEMTAALGAANTATTVGNWKYAVEVTESAADAVTSGTFKVELFIGEVSQGALYMTQGTSDALTAEGVTFTWDLGASLSSGTSVYFVEITEV